jgi:hypothetical protein
MARGWRTESVGSDLWRGTGDRLEDRRRNNVAMMWILLTALLLVAPVLLCAGLLQVAATVPSLSDAMVRGKPGTIVVTVEPRPHTISGYFVSDDRSVQEPALSVWTDNTVRLGESVRAWWFPGGRISTRSDSPLLPAPMLYAGIAVSVACLAGAGTIVWRRRHPRR